MKIVQSESLRYRLIWQLLLFQAGFLLLLALALMTLLIRADLGGVLIDGKSVDTVSSAIVRLHDGRLFLEETPELASMRAANPGFWFMVRDEKGQMLESGPIPDAHRSLGTRLDRINFADIRDAFAPYELSALVRKTSGRAGSLTVLVGGGPFVSLTFALVVLSNLFLLPTLALLAIVAVIAIPWIVRRAFSGVAAIAREAEQIDIDRRGYRLPETGVPAEVRPLVHAVNGALDRLDDGYERHRRFILDAAHELRTPVAILQTRVETLATGPMRTRLLADTGRIAAMAEQLLDLERLGSNGEAFHPIDLVPLCSGIIADMAPFAIASGYELSLETPDGPVAVTGDMGALRRVVVNLIQNAIEHGGQKGTIAVTVEKGGIVEVSDEGPGVPEEERERIFEPFYRLQPRDSGAGLGLSLVKEVMRRHGGYVSIVDNPGGGVCFRLHISG